MDKTSHIEKNIEEALNSLSNIGKAAPAPFFYTRLQSRLNTDERNIWESISRFITRPAIAVFSISLVLLVNIFVVVKQATDTNTYPDQSEMAVVDHYNQANSFYDLENGKP